MCSFMAKDVVAARPRRDEVSDLWSIADLEPEHRRFQRLVCLGYALVLAQMVDPGI